MFSTNNSGHRMEDPVSTAAGIQRNINALRKRLPTIKILLLAILPRDATADAPMRQLHAQSIQTIASVEKP